MRATVKNYLPAIACAIVPILCYIVVRPYAEIGVDDDWSFAKSAQVLAQTGHIAYNGWATPMLGWQLYIGALFIKLFGFCFTAVRMATVIEAMATAFLLERTCERAGLNSWNATLATLTFVLSPLYVPYAFTFMTDVSGVLCIVVCFYMCLRAVQAGSERSTTVWIVLAALVNAVGGTARQIAWLGVLVMVPSTLWLLRKSRRVLVVGSLSCIAGAGFVVAAILWFARQPYNIPEPLFPIRTDRGSLKFIAGLGLLSAGQLALLALPVLLMFAGSLRSWNRRMAAAFASGLLCFACLGGVLIRAGRLHEWLPPFLSDNMTDSAFERLNSIASQGIHFAAARDSLRVLLTGAVVFGILCLAASFFAGGRAHEANLQTSAPISWQKLGIMLGSFSAAYIVILALNRLGIGSFFGRYLLPLLAIAVLVLARFYQERVKANLAWANILLIVLFSGFSVAATHDRFALYRGYASAIDEIRSSGVPATAILGPPEFLGWTQVENRGFMNDPRIRVPADAYSPLPPHPRPAGCNTESAYDLSWASAVRPVYAVLLSGEACDGQIAFPPVMYRTWIPPHANWIYPVRLPPFNSH